MKRGVKQPNKHKGKKQLKTSGSVRIISGQFRGRKLPVIDVEGLRPTTDRNKEMLFNWLMQDVTGAKCLDVFSGSGSLGFEALSRYAQHCTFIELDQAAARKLTDNAALLSLSSEQVDIRQGNALTVLGQLVHGYDVVFLDPPFNQKLLPNVIDLIAKQDLLSIEGLIYIECEPGAGRYTIPLDWQLLKEKQSPQILSRLYQRVIS
ncbi:16S rRNA (guanine(966)-N(2))-methyltransferase RsmD [Paraglaciecola marina]|uniref:16S rRNA (guanine(966)-N(2))-methyltransferase RsmD n=1 Tax=Paraglaciecola marina TaxID=2500157 RepID=UPI00105E120C|nr:16S rRNA (guanine(966)-N(2))-methyltransferase RsmD [Paraglaciecola marina]